MRRIALGLAAVLFSSSLVNAKDNKSDNISAEELSRLQASYLEYAAEKHAEEAKRNEYAAKKEQEKLVRYNETMASFGGEEEYAKIELNFNLKPSDDPIRRFTKKSKEETYTDVASVGVMKAEKAEQKAVEPIDDFLKQYGIRVSANALKQELTFTRKWQIEDTPLKFTTVVGMDGDIEAKFKYNRAGLPDFLGQPLGDGLDTMFSPIGMTGRFFDDNSRNILDSIFTLPKYAVDTMFSGPKYIVSAFTK